VRGEREKSVKEGKENWGGRWRKKGNSKTHTPKTKATGLLKQKGEIGDGGQSNIFKGSPKRPWRANKVGKKGTLWKSERDLGDRSHDSDGADSDIIERDRAID